MERNNEATKLETSRTISREHTSTNENPYVSQSWRINGPTMEERALGKRIRSTRMRISTQFGFKL